MDSDAIAKSAGCLLLVWTVAVVAIAFVIGAWWF